MRNTGVEGRRGRGEGEGAVTVIVLFPVSACLPLVESGLFAFLRGLMGWLQWRFLGLVPADETPSAPDT